jgi:hypothetical protein
MRYALTAVVWGALLVTVLSSSEPDIIGVECECQCGFLQPAPLASEGDYCTGPPAVYASRLCDTYNVTESGIEPCYHLDRPLLCDERWTGNAILRQPADPTNLWLISARQFSVSKIYLSQSGIFTGAQMQHVALLWDDLRDLLERPCNDTQPSPVPSANETLPIRTTALPYVRIDTESEWQRRVIMITHTLRVMGGVGAQCASVGFMNPWDTRVLDATWNQLTIPPMPALSPAPSSPVNTSLSDCQEREDGVKIALVVFSIISLVPWILLTIALIRRYRRHGWPCTCCSPVTYDLYDVPLEFSSDQL